jgi:hypothetical protein
MWRAALEDSMASRTWMSHRMSTILCLDEHAGGKHRDGNQSQVHEPLVGNCRTSHQPEPLKVSGLAVVCLSSERRDGQ